MIAPDSIVIPNHHPYAEVRPEERIPHTLLWGEDGPKHAGAWSSFEDQDGATGAAKASEIEKSRAAAANPIPVATERSSFRSAYHFRL